MDTNFVEGMYGFTRNLLLVYANDLLHYQVKDSKLPNTSPNSYTVNIENISDLSKKKQNNNRQRIFMHTTLLGMLFADLGLGCFTPAWIFHFVFYVIITNDV